MRTKILCAIISLSATLSQNTLPYHANNIEVMTPFIFRGVKNDINFSSDKNKTVGFQNMAKTLKFSILEGKNFAVSELEQAFDGVTLSDRSKFSFPAYVVRSG